MGPLKFTTARPIWAPYSSCSLRIDSGDPSNPDRLARITTGRLLLAALRARATFFDERGNSVPALHWSGPSAGTNPKRGTCLDSMPMRQTGYPPRWASQITAVSAPRMPGQRSRGRWSWSTTAFITLRMSNDFFLPALVSSEKISPTRVKPLSGPLGGGIPPPTRVVGMVVSPPPGEPLARRYVGVLIMAQENVAGLID